MKAGGGIVSLLSGPAGCVPFAGSILGERRPGAGAAPARGTAATAGFQLALPGVPGGNGAFFLKSGAMGAEPVFIEPLPEAEAPLRAATGGR